MWIAVREMWIVEGGRGRDSGDWRLGIVFDYYGYECSLVRGIVDRLRIRVFDT